MHGRIPADARRAGFATPDVVPALLREYGAATRRAVEHYLAAERPAPYLHDLLTDYPRRGGKMMRPAICIANARAFGARLEDAVRSAAAIELLHNALLIHDDIEDGSDLRRGRPTLHKLHGIPRAINAGDALLLLALRPLLDNRGALGQPLSLRILEQTQAMARETAEGQALELGWRDGGATDVTEADYLTMVLKKTAWMATIWPAQIGVLIGGRGETDPGRVVRFGFFLGATFQILDDLLNLTADRAYGKELNGDLYEAKRTLMLIHARRTCGDGERDQIDAFLALRREERTPGQIGWLAGLMARLGSIDYARTVAEALAGAAEHEFALAYGHLPPSPDKDFIAGLIPWVFERI
jgi:geranylgeranyl diphosphate synthase type II